MCSSSLGKDARYASHHIIHACRASPPIYLYRGVATLLDDGHEKLRLSKDRMRPPRLANEKHADKAET